MGIVRIRVPLPPGTEDRSYEILIREGLLDDLAEAEFPLPQASSVFIVTDSTVAKLYGEKLRAGLSRSGRAVGMVAFRAGEASKSIRTVWNIASRLSGLGADRESLLLALGGGVVGDLAGFVASVYKRGIGYVQLPTTLLAQVDSSIGGKTGVDAPWGKNQLGTFHQPSGVLTDPLVLKTLPPREILNCLAEIVKCAVVADRRMFERIAEQNGFQSEVPADFIVDACRIKADIVSKDENEANLRGILNYGHTVGHAIESASNYRLAHGACVVFGMLAESWIARRLGILEEDGFAAQERLLLRLSGEFGLGRPSLSKKKLFAFATKDKKSVSGSVRMSLPTGIGKMHMTKDGRYKIPVDRKTFEGSIDHLREILPPDWSYGHHLRRAGETSSDRLHPDSAW